jgi:hypothetical protein
MTFIEKCVGVLAILAFLLITGVAKSEEKSFNINEMPTKVSNFIKGEVDKTKEYQAKTWAEAKTKWPWNVLLKGKNDTQN